MASRLGGLASVLVGSGLVLSLGFGAPARGTEADPEGPYGIPREERYLYRPVPAVEVATQRGVVRLDRLWGERPVLLTLVYTRCSGVCYPFVCSLRDAVRRVGGLGRDYRVVVLSFDPEDTVETMAAMARNVGLADRPDWIFGVTAPTSIQRLTQAIGYWLRWDPTARQYDHPAVLIGVDRGRVVRFLVGATVEPARLYEVIRELRGEMVGTYPLPRKDVLFRCLRYRPGRGVALDWGFILLPAPGFAAFGITAFLFWSVRRRRACPIHGPGGP
jgi:protein SCO1/2